MNKEERNSQKIDMIVGKNIKKHRKILGLSQKDIANAVGVSIQQVQKYEKCKNRVSSGSLYKVSEKLKIPIMLFFQE